MNELIVLTGLGLLTFVGMLGVESFNLMPGASRLEKIPYWFGIGLGLIAFELFIMSLLSISWDLEIILSFWFLVALILFFKKRLTLNFIRKELKFSFIEKTFLVGIAAILLYVGFEAVIRPLSAYDGWAIWVLKAKMFYIDGYLNPSAYNLLNENYPYAINLGLVFLMKMLGQIDDRSILLLFYSFYFFIAFGTYSLLKRYSSRLTALIFTFLLISTQNVLRHGGRYEAGYADLALGFYILLICSTLLSIIKKINLKSLVLLELLLATASLIKEEGLFFSIIINLFIITYIVFRKRTIFLSVVIIYLIPQAFWQYFKFKNNLNYSLYVPLNVHSGRSILIVSEIIKEMLSFKNWNLLWFVYFLSVVVAFCFKNKEIVIIPIIILIQLVGYFVIFTLSPNTPSEHIPSVMNRLLLHLTPLSVFYIGYVFHRMLSK